ncbi:ubiquitin-domain-containing protein [Hypomontagnella submonticulosa]|nr:ubiquitin-domain-containing protein [Hypomontagnella submonticulosa]
MADSAEGSSDPQITFRVKTSGDTQHTITMAETATVSDLKNKLSGAEFENIPIERQRLIYSGRVMKNDEPLATYKIKNGNTVHLVKSAASNPTQAQSSTPSSSSTTTAPQVPQNMAAGTANNPLAGLTGARYAGMTNLPSADMFGPDGGMVGSMVDEDQLANMLSNPHIAQQLNEMMNNDAFVDMMIQSNPLLRNNPNARDIVRSPAFRRMMTNPEALRSAARLQRAVGGGRTGQNAFPMPGVTDNTPGDASAAASNAGAGNAGGNNTTGNQIAGAPFNLFDPSTFNDILAAGGPGAGAADPFSAFFNPFGMNPATSGGTPAAGGAQTDSGNANANASQGQESTTQPPSNPPSNPFASLFGPNPVTGANARASADPFAMPPGMTPERLQQMLQALGIPSAAGSPAPPTDNRPPEERYAEQLRQLNEMGFYDFDRNVAALRRSGGSVQGAIEHLLSS